MSRDELQYLRNMLYTCIELIDGLLSSSENNPPREPTHAPSIFNLKAISWKVKGGDIVKGEIPVWGSAFAYDTKGDYHEDVRGNLVRYLEREGVYIHNEAGQVYECKLNQWKDNTFINVRKQKNGKGGG